jgi:Uma2 family endonuclease
LSSVLPDDNEYYTYADFLEWDESVRAEIIDGEVYMMASPTKEHQRIFRKIFTRLSNFLEGKTCEVFSAPFDVRLFPKSDLSDNTVVEPDILVVCDPSKLDDRSCNGAPDLVIEILSPSNKAHDKKAKFQKYRMAGVREYWVVDPEEKYLEIHILDSGRYITTVYDAADDAPDTVLPGCVIKLADVFSA